MDKFLVGLWISLSACQFVNGDYNYHFMEDDCNPNGTHVYLDSPPNSLYGHVKLMRDGPYKENMHCKMTIWAPESYHITVRFKYVDIHKPDYDCTDDKLLISGEAETHDFCGHGTPSYSLYSTHNYLELEFFSGEHDFENQYNGFWLYYTAYHHDTCNTHDRHEYQCYIHNRCIPGELTCDYYDNCGDWSDERVGPCGLNSGSIVLISIVTFACVGVCVGGVIYCIMDKKKDNERRMRRQAQNQVVEYSCGGGQAPPAYQTYFATPPYSEQKEMPPAYSNYGYGTTGDVHAPVATAASDNSTAVTMPTGETAAQNVPGELPVPPPYSTNVSPPTEDVNVDAQTQNKDEASC